VAIEEVRIKKQKAKKKSNSYQLANECFLTNFCSLNDHSGSMPLNKEARHA
jgi:hypothetical protein